MLVKKLNTMNINAVSTLHLNERTKRIAVASELLKMESAKLIATFWVDKGHRNGAEIHNLYSNGIIKIYNAKTHREITWLIGKKNQVKRLYDLSGLDSDKYVTKETISFCELHKKLRLNDNDFTRYEVLMASGGLKNQISKIKN